MAIKGEVRSSNFEEKQLRVGFVEANVICINPTREEFSSILGIELQEESKACEYLSESRDGNPSVRLDFWFEDIKTGIKDKITFFLEDKDRENKDGDKKQYINNVGFATFAENELTLPSWFSGSDYRVAKGGESDFYEFARYWLSGLDTRNGGELVFSFKDLIKGKVKEIKEQIGGDFQKTFGALLEVKSVDKEGETKNYQSVYNKGFLYPSDLKFFRLVDYSNPALIEKLKSTPMKSLKRHEKFVATIEGEYGSKNSYVLKDAQDFNPMDFLVTSDAPVSEEY